MEKRGGSVKSWKKRFAVFKGGALSYYEDEDPAKAAKGSVDVVGAHAYDDADTAHHGYGLFVDVPTGGKQGSKRERNSQLQRLLSRLLSTRFG